MNEKPTAFTVIDRRSSAGADVDQHRAVAETPDKPTSLGVGEITDAQRADIEARLRALFPDGVPHEYSPVAVPADERALIVSPRELDAMVRAGMDVANVVESKKVEREAVAARDVAIEEMNRAERRRYDAITRRNMRALHKAMGRGMSAISAQAAVQRKREEESKRR